MKLEAKALIQLLKDIENRLSKLEKQHSSSTESKSGGIHLHVQTMNIDTVQLEELSYYLDKVNIKELSGMLNLGNTFLSQDADLSSQTMKENTVTKNSEEGRSAIAVKINGKNVPYQII